MSAAAPVRERVDDSSQVKVAAHCAAEVARNSGFGAAAVDSIRLAATELAENLHRHAVGGELVIIPPVVEADALVLVAVDRGPGVERFEVCLADGYSTIGTMGVGLGAVRRAAGRFDAVSEPGRGTVVAASFRHDDGGRLPRRSSRAAEQVPPGPAFDIGAVGFAIAPELRNGDGWGALHRGARLVVVVADGLGHGPAAADASDAVVGALVGAADRSPGEMVAAMAEAARPTRGAAVTVATVSASDFAEGGSVAAAGLGNVALVVLAPDGSTHRGVTSPGTAGRGAPVARGISMALPAGGTVVLHTDGLLSRWDLTGRAELLRHDAVVVAAALWRDFARGNDDTCVVVVGRRS